MSHFSVLVVTDQKPDEQALARIMLPFHEYECTGIEKYKKLGDVFGQEWVDGWNGAVPKGDRYVRRTNPRAKWDWYSVGGRWSGALDPAYDPETDQRNIETCQTCGGTGKRDDDLGRKARAEDPSYTCNGCDGKGRSVKWPTQWAKDVAGNQMQAKDLPAAAELDFFAYLRGGEWVERGEMGWWGVVTDEKDPESWGKQKAAIRAGLKPDEWLTVVDCHI